MHEDSSDIRAAALTYELTAGDRRSDRRRQLPAKPHFATGLFLAFLGVLALAPFWFGAKPAAARVLVGTGLALAAAVMLAEHLGSGRGFVLSLRRFAVPLGCCTAVLVWAFVQAWLPVSLLSGDPVWGLAAETLQLSLPAHVSAAPADTLLAAATLAMVMLAFVLASQFGADARRAIHGLQAISLIAAIYAAWGMTDHFLGWNRVLWLPKDPYAVANIQGYVSSTFLNPDHFADLVLMGLACAASLAFRDLKQLGEMARLDRLSLAALGPSLRNGLVMAVLLAALWLTRSRAGFAAALVCMLVFMALLGLRLHAAGRRRLSYAIAASAFGLTALLVVGALSTSIGEARFIRLADGFASRWVIQNAVLDAMSDNLVFGTGWGAFRDAFAVYHTAELGIGTYLNAAHNVYLEAALGLGLPMAMVLFFGVGWCVWRVGTASLRRRQHTTAPIAAATAAAGILAHNAVDFSLQLPAVAILFAALMGFGCAQSWSSRRSE